MTGSPDQPENLFLARTSLRCSLDAGDLATALPVGVSDRLATRDSKVTVPVIVCPLRA